MMHLTLKNKGERGGGGRNVSTLGKRSHRDLVAAMC